MLHCCRCGHYNTYTNKSRQKHNKKLTLALFIKSKLSVEVNIFSNKYLVLKLKRYLASRVVWGHTFFSACYRRITSPSLFSTTCKLFIQSFTFLMTVSGYKFLYSSNQSTFKLIKKLSVYNL